MEMVDLMRLPRVKREKILKEEKQRRKEEMRAALPVLTREEIRRFRLPYHEALLLELEEEGYPSSSQYLRQLIIYQEDMRAQHGPDTLVWSWPRLLETKEHLNFLQEHLRNAEAAHYADNIALECDELIFLAVPFALGSSEWWWLGEQLLSQCKRICKHYKGDGSKREAVSRYICGKFFLFNQKIVAIAKKHLNICREISKGKTWTAKKYLAEKQDSLFTESSTLLYIALIEEAKRLFHSDPVEAIKLCHMARKHAIDACNKLGEAEALKFQGLCQMEAGDATEAAMSFFKVLTLQLSAKRPEGICDARILLALAYLKTDRPNEAHKQLEILLAFAEENNLTFFIAQAHRSLGEFYLNEGYPELATPLLIKALNKFHEISDILNREQARNLAAISAGQELMPKYVSLILKCGKHGRYGFDHVIKLAKWKDTRELFWSEHDVSLESFEDALIATGEEGSQLSLNLPGLSIDLPKKIEEFEAILEDSAEGEDEQNEEEDELENHYEEFFEKENDIIEIESEKNTEEQSEEYLETFEG